MSNLLNLRAGGKWGYEKYLKKSLPIFIFPFNLSELITKELDIFSKILTSIAFYLSWTICLRALGVMGVEMKIFERF